jgi:hypothetical protein
MAQTAAEVIQRIVVAFERRSLPEGATVFRGYSSEVDMPGIERAARHIRWIEIPHDILCANPLALAFMTPEAFGWFLPAYLIVSIALYRETDTLTTTIITCLTLPDEADADRFDSLAEDVRALGVDIQEELPNSLGADDELFQLFRQRADMLSRAEKAAVRDYLEYVEATHSADFPAFGPKQALDRYWATAATSADGAP